MTTITSSHGKLPKLLL